jgi:hypothetical protein
MILKEEITALLDDDNAYTEYGEGIDLDYCVDEILKLIKKSITESMSKYSKSMAKPSSPEEYWIDMGKTLAIKEFMEKEGL